MPRLSKQEFVAKVSELFTTSVSSGSVYINAKRASHPSVTASVPDAQGDTEMSGSSSLSTSEVFPVIFRATNGSSDPSRLIKVSTLVAAHELNAFQDLLQPLIRQHLADLCLRKRDKAKERRVDKEVAQRRKRDKELGGWKGVAKLGSKRGSGRRQRQKALKRAMKLRKAERESALKAKAAGPTDPARPLAKNAEPAQHAPGTAALPPPPTTSAPNKGSKKKKKGKK